MKREACVSLLHPVAYTIDYRGQHDDKLTFLFRGACWAQLVHTFAFLVGKGRGIAQDAFIYRCTDAVARNGKGSWYYAVELDEPNFHFSSLEDMWKSHTNLTHPGKYFRPSKVKIMRPTS
ncbi:MAG: hypothetical protein HXO29_02785, partial [Prevotella sp.]|nr:hypothetical protein [Prevotella sp.]